MKFDKPWKKANEFKSIEASDFTHYIEVPGGWLYRNILVFEDTRHVSMVFIPQPDKCREHDLHTQKICGDCLEKIWKNRVTDG